MSILSINAIQHYIGLYRSIIELLQGHIKKCFFLMIESLQILKVIKSFLSFFSYNLYYYLVYSVLGLLTITDTCFKLELCKRALLFFFSYFIFSLYVSIIFLQTLVSLQHSYTLETTILHSLLLYICLISKLFISSIY